MFPDPSRARDRGLLWGGVVAGWRAVGGGALRCYPLVASNISFVLHRAALCSTHCDPPRFRGRGLLLLHSLAGGTGSGVGAYLTAALRDAFPTRDPLSSDIAPAI